MRHWRRHNGSIKRLVTRTRMIIIFRLDIEYGSIYPRKGSRRKKETLNLFDMGHISSQRNMGPLHFIWTYHLTWEFILYLIWIRSNSMRYLTRGDRGDTSKSRCNYYKF